MTSKIPAAHVRVGRVINEDDNYLTLEVPKELGLTLGHLEPNDRFLTIIFAHTEDNGQLRTWLPWRDDERPDDVE